MASQYLKNKIKRKEHFVILGAGAPHIGDQPSAISEPYAGTSILQWLLNASGCKIDETTFVAGYKEEKIRKSFPNINIIENTDWQETGSTGSLFLATLNSSNPLLVCYSDILFRNTVPTSLFANNADITIAFDSKWKNRYAGRAKDNLQNCEKIIIKNNHIVRLGPDIPLELSNGEFIGLVKFSQKSLNILAQIRATGPEFLRKLKLSECIEYLRGHGLSVEGVDISGDWAEYKEPSDIAQFIMGSKAETLSRLQGIVKNSVIQDQVSFTISEWNSDKEKILTKIRDCFKDLKLVIRSSALNEDSFYGSNAGTNDSVLNVNPNNELIESITKVISSYDEVNLNDQVLVQPMVTDVECSGVIFTRTLDYGAPWYVINYETTGNTETITSGADNDHKTLFIHRNVDQSNLSTPDPKLKNILVAITEIELLLGYDYLDIEFAIDKNNQIYIFQVRPIAVKRDTTLFNDVDCENAIIKAQEIFKALTPSPPHFPGNSLPLFGVMPDWNPAEIIGRSPSTLASSIYRYLIMDETWAKQRSEYGYRDVRPAQLMKNFAGQPYVDVRASFCSFLPSTINEKLSGKLLDFYLNWLRKRPELHDKVEFEVVPTCITPGFENWEKRFYEEGKFTFEEIRELRNGLLKITQNAFYRSDNDLNKITQLSERYKFVIEHNSYDLLEKAKLLLDDCRRLGALPFAHLARSGFIAINLLNESVKNKIISNEAFQNFLSSIRTVSHDLQNDAQKVKKGSLSWDGFVKSYGHLRPGTYDITSPRYDSDPYRYLEPIILSSQKNIIQKNNLELWNRECSHFLKILKKLKLPYSKDVVLKFLYQSIEGREYAKFIFSRNLSSALELLTLVGEKYGLRRDMVDELLLDEILNLNNETASDIDICKNLKNKCIERKKLRQITMACKLPPLLTSPNDFNVFLIGADRPNFVSSGKIIAEKVIIEGQSFLSKQDIKGKIVLIEKADPGYDWLFGQEIGGLVTLYGGANSHMAIRAAEFSIPAAIGVGEQRYRQLSQGKLIDLSPSNGILRVIR